MIGQIDRVPAVNKSRASHPKEMTLTSITRIARVHLK